MHDGITRRRLIAVGGSLAVGGTALLTSASDGASAQVSMDGFALEDSEHVVDDPQSVTITVPVAYAWDAPYEIDVVRLTLSIGDSMKTLDAVAVRDIQVAAQAGEGTHTFDAVDLTQTYHFAVSSFAPGESSVDNLVAAGVRMELLQGETVVADAYDDDAGQITTHTSGSITTSFNATGSVSVT